jgi:hypothetical protein
MVANVLLYKFLHKPSRRYRKSSGPKLIATEILLPPSKLPGYCCRALQLCTKRPLFELNLDVKQCESHLSNQLLAGLKLFSDNNLSVLK